MNLDIYNSPKLVKELSRAIRKEAEKQTKTIRIMHICGTHENSIVRFGIRDLLPENIEVIAGPGCPVCVTSSRDIDAVVKLVLNKDVKLLTFGDMIKVPGTKMSFAKAKSLGADIQMVYSIFDAIDMSKSQKKQCVFFACGFETTTAPTAAALKESDIPDNFSIYSVHKYTPNGVYALLSSGKISMDALILPGHAATISGLKVYEKFVDKFGIPCVSAGFEAVDVLLAILMITKQINAGKPEIENGYRRVIEYEGNRSAQKFIDDVFELKSTIWRGLGAIDETGYELKGKYKRFDAKQRFDIQYSSEYIENQKGCRCSEVILGSIKPIECPLFDRACNPANPIGPCMVSDEGTCKNWYDGGVM